MNTRETLLAIMAEVDKLDHLCCESGLDEEAEAPVLRVNKLIADVLGVTMDEVEV